MSKSEWFKSSRSGGSGNCVEVRYVDGVVEVRDSKDPEGPVLRFSADAWSLFLADVRADAPDGAAA